MIHHYKDIVDPQLIGNLQAEDIAHVVDTQVSVANYLRSPANLQIQPDRRYYDNSSCEGLFLKNVSAPQLE
jgi:hypothetical protein